MYFSDDNFGVHVSNMYKAPFPQHNSVVLLEWLYNHDIIVFFHNSQCISTEAAQFPATHARCLCFHYTDKIYTITPFTSLI